MPSIRARLDKLERIVGGTDKSPNWLFISVIDGDGSILQSIQDINLKTGLPPFYNDDKVATDDFLSTATDFYSINMHEAWNEEGEEIDFI